MGKRGLKSLLAGASVAAVGASTLVVGGAPGVNATTHEATTTVVVDMTCVPDPLTKEEFGNTAISGGIAEGLFDPGPDTIRWTADDVPLSPIALPLEMDITHPTVAQPGQANSVSVFMSQDFGQLATDTQNDQIISQLPPSLATFRTFMMFFGSSYPRLGFFIQPPTGTTFDLGSLTLLQTPDDDNAVSHGVPPLETTGLADADGVAEASTDTLLQVEVGDELDTGPRPNVNYTNKGDRSATGYTVEPEWTDTGVVGPPAVAPNAAFDRVQSDAWDVTAGIDINVPMGAAGTDLEFYPVAVPVDFNLGLWIWATLDGQTSTTSGRVNFDWECTADNPASVLLTVPVASVGTDSISGTVTEDGSGTPLSGVSVRLLDDSFHLIEKMDTDVNGDYLFDNLDGSATYNLRFVDTSMAYIPEFHSDGATRFDATSVSGFTGNLDVDAALVAGPRGTVDGTVTEDGTGDPIPGISVRLLTAGGSLVGVRTSQADGYFRFGNFPTGSYIMRFIDTAGTPTHVTEFHADKTTRFDADPFSIVQSTVVAPGTTINGQLAPVAP